jgi:hypothetical protein
MAQTAAVMAASRMGGIMYGAGVGAGIFVLFSNADSLKLYSKELARMTLHFLSRPGYDNTLLINGHPSSGDPNRHGGGNNVAAMAPLTERLDQLTMEMARIRQGQTLSGLVGGPPSLTTTIVVIGTTGVVLYISGIHSWSDIMYVTKKHFNTTVEALKEGVTGLASALARVRHELLEKVGVVEVKVDEARFALEEKIDGVHDEVKGVAKSQDLLEELIRGIEGKIELTQDQVKQANRGIVILCSVIAESGVMNEELLEFTRKHGGTQGGPKGSSKVQSSVVNNNNKPDVPQQAKYESNGEFSINDVLLREGLQHLITMTTRTPHNRPTRTASNNSENLPTAVALDPLFSSFSARPTTNLNTVKTVDPA